METLELPVLEIDDAAPPENKMDIAENEMDLAAFRLWRTASRLDEPEDPNR
jgi:hypothetical protein